MRRIKSIVEMRSGAYYTAMVTYRNGKRKLYGYGMDAYPRAVERSSADAPAIAHGFGFKDVATVQDPEVIALSVTREECERETVASFLGTYHIYAGRQDVLVLLPKEVE